MWQREGFSVCTSAARHGVDMGTCNSYCKSLKRKRQTLSVLYNHKTKMGIASWFTTFLSDISDPRDWRLDTGQEISCPCLCLPRTAFLTVQCIGNLSAVFLREAGRVIMWREAASVWEWRSLLHQEILFLSLLQIFTFGFLVTKLCRVNIFWLMQM